MFCDVKSNTNGSERSGILFANTFSQGVMSTFLVQTFLSAKAKTVDKANVSMSLVTRSDIWPSVIACLRAGRTRKARP